MMKLFKSFFEQNFYNYLINLLKIKREI